MIQPIIRIFAIPDVALSTRDDALDLSLSYLQRWRNSISGVYWFIGLSLNGIRLLMARESSQEGISAVEGQFWLNSGAYLHQGDTSHRPQF